MILSMKKIIINLVAIFGLVLAVTFMVSAKEKQTSGAQGYDLVSYQTVSKAVAGDTSQAVYHNGTTYLFSSKENKATFEADPAKYLPAYGGYCAMGIALGKKLPSDPKAFRVVDGTLYLNLNKKVQKMWFKDIPGHIETADEKWNEIKGYNAADL